MATDARGRLIDSAVEIMREQGVAGMGLTELTRRSGTARRSIYLNFPGGKSELVAEATRTVGNSLTKLLESIAAQTSPVLAFAELWESVLLESDFEAGCPIAAATLGHREAAEANHVAGDVFTDWREQISVSMRQRGVDPDVSSSLATTVIAAIEGAVLLSQAQHSTDPLHQVARHMAELIEVHTRS